MLTKWRSLVVIGVMLAALVCGSTAAWAQTPLTAPAVNSVVQVGYDSLLANWSGNQNADTEEFEVGWIETDSADVFGAASPTTEKVNVNRTQYVITGLDAQTEYLVGVRALPSDAATHANSAWNYASTARTSTGMAPSPDPIRDRDIVITPGNGELTVKWEEPDAGDDDLTITEYFLEWAEEEDGSDSRRWPHMITDRIVTIDRLENGTMYYVAVGSENSAGSETMPDFAEAASGTPMAPEEPPVPDLAAPTGVTAIGVDEAIDVSWNAVAGADSYEVSWMQVGGSATTTAMEMGTSYTIENVMNGTEYSVQVSAMMGDMKSPPSAAVTAMPMADPLDAPMNVMAEGGDSTIMVSWGAVERADSYKVSWTAGGVTASATATGTSHTIENLMNGTEYSVTVSAMMGDMEGPASAAAMATPMPAEPVPALPLFGMLALGAGLVAAGRRRLHAQRLLKN